MQKKNAATVLQDFTAAVAVQQMRTISAMISLVHMTSDVNFRKSVLSVRS